MDTSAADATGHQPSCRPGATNCSASWQGEEPTYGLMGSADGNPDRRPDRPLQGAARPDAIQYTDRHPQVQSLNETIARLEKEKLQGAKISPSVAPPGAGISSDQALVRSLDMNPVYQNLRLALSQADADLAELRGQVGAQQAQVADLRSKVNTYQRSRRN